MLYLAGEALGPHLSIAVIGVRIAGGEDEHAPHHLEATGALDNLRLSARVMRHLQPASVMWACTSGSFIAGLAYARAQADAIAEAAGAPASSTALAFLWALAALGISRVGVLASYPEQTARAFSAFLAEGGFDTADMAWMDAPSGPAAAQFGDERLLEAAGRVRVPKAGALLIPDTAVPSLGLIGPLERRLGRPVLTANQVTLWAAARLAGLATTGKGPGWLFAG
jgi:maleate cis-trans isomerase